VDEAIVSNKDMCVHKETEGSTKRYGEYMHHIAQRDQGSSVDNCM
jgi:hypothetical protein